MFEFITNYFKQEPLPASTIPELKEIISSSPIVIFSKTYCPYCTSTKTTISQLNKVPKIIELDTIENGSIYQRGLEELTGQRTVPNVFLNGKHIGGNSDLQQLKNSGKLQSLLN